MKYTKLLMAVALAAALIVVSVGCSKSSATVDFRVTSSVTANHTHNVTISGTDVDNPPASKTITTDGTSHTHTITLTQQDYQSLKNGQAITVTTSASGTPPHTHTFTIQKPVQQTQNSSGGSGY
ncbi:MAG TPA: hypothetical protein VF318_08620 [Dehalococcoidales bacterium]|jgi:hypothetical protein